MGPGRYREGRFRDDLLGVVEVEYRFPVRGWFGGVAFGSLGDVADELDQVQLIRDFERARLEPGCGSV